MSLAAAWVLFPLLLAALSLGCGLLLERAAGERLHGALLVPAGLAVIVVAGQLTTAADSLAKLALPATIVLSAAGFAAGHRRLRAVRVDPWALAAAVGVLLAFGAPILLSGHATFAGYIMLDDTATFAGMTDRLMEHGRDLTGLPGSTYEATLAFNLAKGYPMGSMLPLGTVRPLVGQDLLWLYQPYLAFLAAICALCIYAIASGLIATPRRRAVVAFLAAQPAVLYAYSLQGGVKELAAAFLLALLAALAAPLLREPGGWRSVLPAAVAVGAFVATLSTGGVAWSGPILGIAAVAVLAIRRGRVQRRLQLRQAGAFIAAGGVLAAIALSDAGFLGGDAVHVLTSSEDKGNLIAPLSKFQAFGVWPAGDYRTPLGDGKLLAYALIAAMAVLAFAGVAQLVRRGRWDVLLYPVGGFAAWLAISIPAGIWVDGKAIATVAPAILFASIVGTVAVARAGSRGLAVALLAAIAVGVGYSNVLAYRDVNLAPRDQLAELERIGGLVDGKGPTLDNEYNPYAARHLLRDGDPEGPSELRRRTVLLNDGRYLLKGAVADLDLFALASILDYRSLVVPVNPAASRPPSGYRRVYAGDFYDLWQSDEATRRRNPILTRFAAGDYDHAAAVPRCRDIVAFARRARTGPQIRLRAALRPANVTLEPFSLRYPATWLRDGYDARRLLPTDDGLAYGAIDVPRGGRWVAWLGGSFSRGFEVGIDGHRVGEARWRLNNLGQYARLGEVELTKGRHLVTLEHAGRGLHPGSGSRLEGLGPFSLEPAGARTRLVEVRPDQAAQRLCGKSIDWIEAVTTSPGVRG